MDQQDWCHNIEYFMVFPGYNSSL